MIFNRLLKWREGVIRLVQSTSLIRASIVRFARSRNRGQCENGRRTPEPKKEQACQKPGASINRQNSDRGREAIAGDEKTK